MSDFQKADFVINDFDADFFPAFKKINSHSNAMHTFFRGHGQEDWDLTPVINRPEHKHMLKPGMEKTLFQEYETYAHMQVGEMTSWDVLFSMRHHGLPTRLLDWSDSLLVALFFAIRDYEKAELIYPKETLKNPCLWVMDGALFNEKIAKKSGFVYIKINEVYKYDYFLDRVIGKSSADFPADAIAIFPPKSNHRLLAQGGMFTFHKKLENLQEAYREILFKVEINKTQVVAIKKFLHFSGMKESNLFPDLDGLSRQLSFQIKHTK